MKKGSKSNIGFTLFLFVVFTLLGLGYVSVKLKCEAMVKERYLLSEKLKAIGNQNTALLGSRQDLSSEERIIDIAKNELGMVPITEQQIILNVSKEKIEEINKILQKKYE
jgi:cell division protein FtsL